MPSTPRFQVTQDAAFVYIHINVPFVRVSEMEYHIDGVHFTFYCKPYLLKLQFPNAVVDNELAKAVYDPNKDNGTIVVHLPKQEPGVDFPDLDLLTRLLQPKKAPGIDLKTIKASAPLIEVLESNVTGEETTDGTTLEATHEPSHGDSTLLELEKRFASVAKAEEESYNVRVTDLKVKYGFNNAFADVFRSWHGESSEIVSLPNPDDTPATERRSLREIGEDTHFDVERYLLDFANAEDDEYFAMAMEYKPHWTQYPPITAKQRTVVPKPRIQEIDESITEGLSNLRVDAAESDRTQVEFTDVERELLQRLPNKEFLIARASNEERCIKGGLVDILFGYVYEQLTNQGDSGIESTWTISIISPTLSWLDSQSDMSAVIRSGVRRMLAFPLLRQYQLAIRVIRETGGLLRRGKRVVLRSLLDIYRIVEKSETQYLLNTIYIQDYCIWIQSVSDEELLQLSDGLASSLTNFKKADSGWALEEMERQLFADESSSSESSDDSSDDESREEDESESSDDDVDDSANSTSLL